MTTTENNEICCPPFNPTLWDEKLLEWHNKPFIKSKVFTLFYMPVNFGKVMKNLDQLVIKSEASIPDFLCLSEHKSKWGMDVYLAVDKEVKDAENISLSGKFYSKVYEGPFKDTGKWTNDYNTVAESKEFKIKKWYMWYTTCPKCAKKYGKNYVVIVGQIE